MPPQVEADTGPNKIQAPEADAVKLAVKENNPTLICSKIIIQILNFFE